jgi:hypothetical protein
MAMRGREIEDRTTLYMGMPTIIDIMWTMRTWEPDASSEYSTDCDTDTDNETVANVRESVSSSASSVRSVRDGVNGTDNTNKSVASPSGAAEKAERDAARGGEFGCGGDLRESCDPRKGRLAVATSLAVQKPVGAKSE